MFCALSETKGMDIKMKKIDKKLVIIPVVLVLVIGIMFTVWQLNKPTAAQGTKEVSVSIISERDNYKYTEEGKTDLEYLGDYLVEKDIIEYEDSGYGRFITSVKNLDADYDNQYWWCVVIDGESSTVGIDEIVIIDGMKCTLELKQGW